MIRFDLYKKTNRNWTLIQNYSFEKGDIVLSADTDEDFNNDGYKDVKISYAQARRGANEIYKLFIFDPKKNKLIDNKKLHCINSYAFFGGNTTTFLRLHHNRLIEFAGVDYYDGEIESYIIKNNHRVTLKKAKYRTNDAAVFFSNYNPVEE